MAVPETIIRCANSVTDSAPKEFKDAGKSYHEWYHNKKGDSWKTQVKKDINECIKKALSYEEFLRLMKDKGYEINGEAFGEGSAKYISFRPYGKDRFVRGRAGTLGADYTKERIRERIEEKTYPDISTDLIDTATEKRNRNPSIIFQKRSLTSRTFSGMPGTIWRTKDMTMPTTNLKIRTGIIMTIITGSNCSGQLKTG